MPTRERAIIFVMGVLRNAKDWQEGAHALAEHRRFGPWLRKNFPDPASEAQNIIREAEDTLGDQLPY